MDQSKSKNMTVESVFTDIFDHNKWQGSSPSGPGSSLMATELMRARLVEVFLKFNIRQLCDAPSGDGTWIFEITNMLDLYLGIDVVKPVVDANLHRRLPPNHLFAIGDIVEGRLPSVDAILCRDCLVHLPLAMGVKAIENFRQSGSRLLISTTFPSVKENKDSGIGGWRPLNLTAAPFNLPDPLHLIKERRDNPEDRYNDKSLGVWALS